MLISAEHESSKFDKSNSPFAKPSAETFGMWRFSLFLPIK